jgi:hypothetical protein
MARLNQDENNGRLLAYAAMHKRGEIAVVPWEGEDGAAGTMQW